MTPVMNSRIFIYGPPGSGKSALGRILAESLDLPFLDLDAEVEAQFNASIPEIFRKEGEHGFRQRERAVLERLVHVEMGVIALGGGALLDDDNRELVERHGKVVFLTAHVESLLERLENASEERPLLVNDLPAHLERLLVQRGEHYESFSLTIDTTARSLTEIAWEAQVLLGRFHVTGMGGGYDVLVHREMLDNVGELLAERQLRGPVALVSDERVAAIYAERVLEILRRADYSSFQVTFPAGEMHKSMETVGAIWDELLHGSMERGSTLLALGGGVTGDLAGFAAATLLRGVSWVTVPTSLLAMVDASIGGKTGVDMPQGKNLVGAFYPPRLVVIDPLVLDTLPEVELRSGIAEVVKAGVIGDELLFRMCLEGWESVMDSMEEIVRRAVAVKVRVVQDDPYEKGPRAKLNLGHTIGHALEAASGFSLRHGEAVSIGMVAAARISEKLALADDGLVEEIADALSILGLPVKAPPGLDWEVVLRGMRMDKKRSSGGLRFALPVRIGEVQVGIGVEDMGLIHSVIYD